LPLLKLDDESINTINPPPFFMIPQVVHFFFHLSFYLVLLLPKIQTDLWAWVLGSDRAIELTQLVDIRRVLERRTDEVKRGGVVVVVVVVVAIHFDYHQANTRSCHPSSTSFLPFFSLIPQEISSLLPPCPHVQKLVKGQSSATIRSASTTTTTTTSKPSTLLMP